MKNIPYKFSLLLLVYPLLLTANNGDLKGKHTKEKTIKKEFNVHSDALLKIDNSYGNLNITSWEQDKVVIEVHIKTNGNNEEKVQEKLDNIRINFDASNSIVSAKTIFDKNKSGWGWNWGKNNNINIEVNYTIKLPVKNSVNLSNDYGNITLNRIDGHAKISCDYGRLDIGELRGRNNQLSFDYTSKSNIRYIESGKISADYSGFTIEDAGNLIVNADYTNSIIHKMDNLEFSCDYGNIEVGAVKNIEGNSDYANIRLGYIHGNVDLVSDYGSIRIKEMAEDAGNLQMRTEYTGIKIGYSSQYYFDFEIETEYAGVSGRDNFEINSSIVKSSEKYYKGFYGTANSGNTVSIDCEYGGVSFIKN